MIQVDAMSPGLKHIPYPIDQEHYRMAPDFFTYINNYWCFLKLDLSHYDLVISTQPPSFALNHPNHICLFYHHAKAYYDLSDLIQETSLQQPCHRQAVDIIREIDTISLGKLKTILAGSETIKARLLKFNRYDGPLEIIRAGIDDEMFAYDGGVSYEYPIVVGRHEFPKRPELFVKAMKELRGLAGKVIGEGGRTADLQKIDMLLTYSAHQGIAIADDIVWKHMSIGWFMPPYERLLKKARKAGLRSNVIFTGRVSKKQLIQEYAKALCVVCPAYEEDYGLTAVEAMSMSKPVIACKDGGGYTEFIQDGVNGFLVDPSSEQIAKAIRYLWENPDAARKMGEHAYESSRRYSWTNFMDQLMKHIN